MILILAEPGTEPAAQAIAAALSAAYPSQPPTQMVAPATTWSRSVEWDDVLFVVYNSVDFPTAVNYITGFLNAHKTSAVVIPVSVDPAFRRPPDPISGIKAAVYDGTQDATDKIVNAAGVFLGLALRPRREKIFVSYRASDGTALAKAIYDRLKAEGFQPWLDEANENLATGDDVQEKIRENIESAAMILLVDTPDAPDSRWVTIEVDTANALLIPILPVVAGGEQISRFFQLQSLRRQARVKQKGFDTSPLSDDDWTSIHSEIEDLMLTAYCRRLRILTRTQAAFAENGYAWKAVNEGLRMYRADKSLKLIGPMAAFSHCLVHDITYAPALVAYWNYLSAYQDLRNVNYKLCVYDRDKVLSEAEINSIKENTPVNNMILAHYNELDLLVATNFSVLRK